MAISAISSSVISGAVTPSYALSLAKTALLQKDLSSLGTDINNSDISQASSDFRTLVQDNPQYNINSASSAVSTVNTAAADAVVSGDNVTGGNPSGSNINTDFQAIAQAIDNNSSTDAKTALAQLQTDLATEGLSITSLSNSQQIAVAAAAILQQATEQTLFGALFSGSSTTGASLNALIGADTTSSASQFSNVITDWLTYSSKAVASNLIGQMAGSNLNALA